MSDSKSIDVERLVTGESWKSFCETLEGAARLVVGEGVPDSPRDRAEGFRYLSRFLASGLVSCVTHDDPDYPVFGRMMDYTRPWGLDFPDCLYLYASVRGGAEYRVWGNRGSANHFDLQVNSGHFADGDIAGWGTIASINGFELQTDADGSFEIWIGGDERPGNWIASASDAEFILLRQLFNDWENEAPGDFAIERVGASWPIPSPDPKWMAQRLEKLSRWIEKGGGLWEAMSRGLLGGEPHQLTIHLPESAGKHTGTGGQAYGMGSFACEPDEAVVIQFEPPKCHHWSVSLANYYWECVEFASRQSSLNGAQARLDDDGIFRGVIAHEDPGVPNWLDPAGNTRGSLAIRFVLAEAAPGVQFERIPRGRLREVLPASTPVVDAATRAHRLERRRNAAIARYRR